MQVNLPEDSLIECRSFCHSIAKALCPPVHEKGLAGVDCIRGKWLPPFSEWLPATSDGRERYGSPDFSLFDDEQRFTQSLQDNVAVSGDGTAQLPLVTPLRTRFVEASWVWQPLGKDDFRTVSKLLPRLPELHYPMSESEAAAFIVAYFHLGDRPSWVPDLVNVRAIEQRRLEQLECVAVHMRLLFEEFEKGRIVTVDERHTPTRTLCAGCYIPRAQAIAHLQRHGLEYRDPGSSEGRGDTECPKSEKQLGLSDVDWRPGQLKLSSERKQALFEYHNRLKKEGNRAFVKLTAEEFGVSRKHVYEVVKEFEAARETIGQRLAAKPRR